jgi:hypothetical protein
MTMNKSKLTDSGVFGPILCKLFTLFCAAKGLPHKNTWPENLIFDSFLK